MTSARCPIELEPRADTPTHRSPPRGGLVWRLFEELANRLRFASHLWLNLDTEFEYLD
jgi:hypothetical protein